MKIDQWLVIDDGKKSYRPKVDCDYYYREPQANESRQTMNLNIAHALDKIKGDVIFFLEDDEYYAPRYIQTMIENMQDKKMVGICCSKYYHLPTKTYFVHGNVNHASLAQTAITKELLPELEKIIKDEDPFIDLKLWATTGKKKPNVPYRGRAKNFDLGDALLFHDGDEDCLYVGMKGMPGRAGIGSGHKGIGRHDSRGVILRKWMPIDCEKYLAINFGNDLHCIKNRRVC